ncbi:MAG: hypothetical protein Q9160_005650 [Pyrenula sp. 1 TL-2023]
MAEPDPPLRLPDTSKHQVEKPAVSDRPPSPSGANVHTDHRTSHTWRTSLFHYLARAIRPHLANGSGKPFPPGSPQLPVDSVAKRKCHVREYKMKDVWLYELRPKGKQTTSRDAKAAQSSASEDEDPAQQDSHAESQACSPKRTSKSHEEPAHDLYYFAGGGFSSPPSPEHWRFFTKLSHRLPQYRLVIVSYPLAPASPAPAAIPILQDFITSVLADAHSRNHAVTLAGDSAGGNLALVLGIDALTSQEPGHEKLRNIMAICPVVDLRNNHPDMSSVDVHDPLLTAKFTGEVAARWADSWPRDHVMLSPVVADLNPLARAGISIHGVVADRDVLSLDTVIFKNKCEEVGVGGEWLEWEKAMHCFPLAGAYGKIFPESWEGLEWIIEVLGRHC